MLGHKADVNVANQEGRTALHYALEHGATREAIQCLLEHNAGVNIADRRGRTPLLVPRGTLGVTVPGVKILLSRGAYLHVKDNFRGETPLHALVGSDCIEAVRFVLEHLSTYNGPASMQAVLMCRDKRGRVPIHNSKHWKMAQALLEQPLLENEEQVVPRVCHEMLFAKDGFGHSFLDGQDGDLSSLDVEEEPLILYFVSYTNLSLMVPERRPPTPCEHHRDKRPRLDATTLVPLNPNLNAFQRNIAKAFLNLWNRSFRRAGTTADEHAMLLLPDDLKYGIMAYLSPADIMKI